MHTAWYSRSMHKVACKDICEPSVCRDGRGGFQQNLENLQEKIFKPNKVLKVGLGEIITCSLSPLNKSKFRTYFLGPLQYVCIHVMSHCLHALNIQHVIVYERSRL